VEATVAEVQATGPQGLEPKEVQGKGSGCFLAEKPRTGKAKDSDAQSAGKDSVRKWCPATDRSGRTLLEFSL